MPYILTPCVKRRVTAQMEVNRECFLVSYAKGDDPQNFSSADDSQSTVYIFGVDEAAIILQGCFLGWVYWKP